MTIITLLAIIMVLSMFVKDGKNDGCPPKNKSNELY
jgi:hypothetical protein